MRSVCVDRGGRRGGWWGKGLFGRVWAVGGLAGLAVGGAGESARADFPQIKLEVVNSGQLQAPVGLVNAGDGSGRLFTVDQRGKIEILQNGSVLATPFLDIGSKLIPERGGFDERGLLGVAFHPDFTSPGADGEGKFYVYYSAPSPNAPGTAAAPVDHRSVVAEYTVSAADPNVADAASERILLTFDQPQFNHDAGQVAFGPDGLLYIGSGDGGSANDNNAGHTGGNSSRPADALGNAQDRTNLLGKILRVDPFGSNGATGEYGIPGSNPFVGDGGGIREEIYAFGLRNPWRFSFDDGPGGTGDLFVADVGQGLVEEVNIVHSGDNLGWRIKEGTRDFAASPNPLGIDPTDPIAEYAHPGAGIGLPEIGLSITGGFVYRGSAFPELVGKYIFADWSNAFGTPAGTLLGLEEDGSGGWTLEILDVLGGNPIAQYITAFGEDESGEIYVVTRTNVAPTVLDPGTGEPIIGGIIYRIVPVPEPGSVVVMGLALCGVLTGRRGAGRS